MRAEAVIPLLLGVAFLAVVVAIAVSSSRAVAKERLTKPEPSEQDLGYFAEGTGGLLSDTDQVEDAYLESRLAGYEPSGRLSDPGALRKLASKEE